MNDYKERKPTRDLTNTATLAQKKQTHALHTYFEGYMLL